MQSLNIFWIMIIYEVYIITIIYVYYPSKYFKHNSHKFLNYWLGHYNDINVHCNFWKKHKGKLIRKLFSRYQLQSKVLIQCSTSNLIGSDIFWLRFCNTWHLILISQFRPNQNIITTLTINGLSKMSHDTINYVTWT